MVVTIECIFFKTNISLIKIVALKIFLKKWCTKIALNYIFISAVKQLIVVNCIQNKFLFT